MLHPIKPRAARLTEADRKLLKAMHIAVDDEPEPAAAPRGPENLYDPAMVNRLGNAIQDNWALLEANRGFRDQAHRWFTAWAWTFAAFVALAYAWWTKSIGAW